MNIIKDELIPQSFGEFIDALLIENIRMWHAQELIYETETLDNLTREEMLNFLKEATWLNLMRNSAIDAVDSSFATQIVTQYPNIERRDVPVSMKGQLPIWEEIN
ncbi:MAG: hypothetical protein HC820_02150 [Hydrococcus sp. RM1_1_31]|nr:hypothetical protein [Hydrococcus sp. RM1_1_31]